ncbi:uncharacterized protein trdc [Austrofundulus limnaeus]|uniref:Uncharacterized protein trdc n=1 Tax=Austrofundulus limnaeus TaxID=52670 RepID=A0A2I4CSC2_AUSLI|nr:PREDICTED: uncharacterized protein LOC106531540 [Austrofundulus limnaeus]
MVVSNKAGGIVLLLQNQLLHVPTGPEVLPLLSGLRRFWFLPVQSAAPLLSRNLLLAERLLWKFCSMLTQLRPPAELRRVSVPVQLLLVPEDGLFELGEDVFSRGGQPAADELPEEPNRRHSDPNTPPETRNHRLTDESPVAPTLFVLTPLQPPGSTDQPGPNVCLATDFRPKDQNLVLKDEEGSATISTTNAVLSTTTRTFYFPAFSNRTIQSCSSRTNAELEDNGADDESDITYPEKAQQNSYLLMINGVRVVFTKAVVFSTVFTIRDVLF